MRFNLYQRNCFKRFLYVVGLVILLSPIGSAASDSSLGNVNFDTSCGSEANPEFEHALGLLHHMMYRQADQKFSAGSERWPDCAMFSWGVAMSQFQPVRPGKPSKEAMQRGYAAVDAMNNISKVSPLERAFVKTASAFYKDDSASYRDRIAAWADSVSAAYKQFPDSAELTSFYALSLLATAPRGDKEYKQQLYAGEKLEELNARNPLHPGVYHYSIHAYDNKGLFERALPFAREYGKIAPEVPHALHMPSHIFVRTGDWDEVISWNLRSADAALQQSKNNKINGDYAHAMDYLVYAQLQLGEFEKAEENVAKLKAVNDWQDNFGSAYALAASPVRVLLEREDWESAAALADDLPKTISWKKYPQSEAMLWFAKGLGAARSGQPETARKTLVIIRRLRESLLETGQDYWVKLIDAQLLTIEAWVELENGNHDLALTKQTEAADLEDDIGKSPVTPGHVLPARELLGDMHAKLGNIDNASTAYQNVLTTTPGRLRSVLALN